MNIINSCNKCFSAVIPDCVDEFKIGGFKPNTGIILYVENFHGKSNALSLTSDAGGIITVPFNSFVSSYFNKDNSPYIFEFKENASDCKLLTFTQCDENKQTDFTCLMVDFITVNNPLLYTNAINCQCP